jgi:hypothetical protein
VEESPTTIARMIGIPLGIVLLDCTAGIRANEKVGFSFFFFVGGDTGGIIAMLGFADKFVSSFGAVDGITGADTLVSVVAGILESSSDSLPITAMSDGVDNDGKSSVFVFGGSFADPLVFVESILGSSVL